MTTWGFEERQSFERSQSLFLEACWKRWWPEATRTPVTDRQTQLSGIDAFLYAGKAKVAVEEKVRARDYGDVLLELVSNDRTRTPGWSVKGAASRLLLYAFADTRRAWVFPMTAVQVVTNLNASRWRGRYGEKIAKNPGYNSVNVAVPFEVFMHVIDMEHGIVLCPTCVMVCEWSDMRGPVSCSSCVPRGSTFEIRLERAA